MYKLLTNKKTIILLIILTVFVTLLSILLPLLSPLKVIHSIPSPETQNFPTNQSLVVNFNKTTSPSQFLVASTPLAEWEITSGGTKELIIAPTKQLQQNTEYKVSLSRKGRLIYSLHFKTQATQTDYDLIKSVKNELKDYYPLASFMPYEAPGFRMVYSGPLTLEISLKNVNITQDEALEYARTWVKDQRIDPTSHKYIVNETILSPAPTTSSRPLAAPSLSPSPTSLEIDWDNLQDDGT